ncbi:hypothetical protein [Streptomyces sp. NPDC057877]|uniref:hypothetical protein n=1 Tax=Streptomyces sp. NPDC057877 TaxID=3346269 RepID=UPI0036C1CFF8
MYDTDDEATSTTTSTSRSARVSGPAPRACPHRVPPLRLAGIDEDDTFEPHLVRGID